MQFCATESSVAEVKDFLHQRLDALRVEFEQYMCVFFIEASNICELQNEFGVELFGQIRRVSGIQVFPEQRAVPEKCHVNSYHVRRQAKYFCHFRDRGE